MVEKATVGELFELAIAAEKAAEEFYRGLETKFAHHPEVASFWKGYATEEVGHARWLERLRGTLSPDQLSAPADTHMLEQLHAVLHFSVADALKGVENLQDAYQLVNELENSETNAIFEFLITHFSADEKTATFLRTQLKSHIGKLMIEFPTQFKSVSKREATKVLR